MSFKVDYLIVWKCSQESFPEHSSSSLILGYLVQSMLEYSPQENETFWQGTIHIHPGINTLFFLTCLICIVQEYVFEVV